MLGLVTSSDLETAEVLVAFRTQRGPILLIVSGASWIGLAGGRKGVSGRRAVDIEVAGGRCE
jgi:hypothetical protein